MKIIFNTTLKWHIFFLNISCPFAQKAQQSSQRMDQARLLYLNELRPLDYDLYVTEVHVILKLHYGF